MIKEIIIFRFIVFILALGGGGIIWKEFSHFKPGQLLLMIIGALLILMGEIYIKLWRIFHAQKEGQKKIELFLEAFRKDYEQKNASLHRSIDSLDVHDVLKQQTEIILQNIEDRQKNS